MDMMIPVSPGELIDKLTILQIKKEKLTDDNQLLNVTFEFVHLEKEWLRVTGSKHTEYQLYERLKQVNEELWDAEEEVRRLANENNYHHYDFTHSAKLIVEMNDLRSRIKREINDLFGSAIVEEKSY